MLSKRVDGLTLRKCLNELRVGIMKEEKNEERIDNREQEVC